MLSKNT